jgi:hypothetical protein
VATWKQFEQLRCSLSQSNTRSIEKILKGTLRVLNKKEYESHKITSDDGAKEMGNNEVEGSYAQDATDDAPCLQSDSLLPQYGLLDFSIRDNDGIGHHGPIMFNMHAPNSMFICGSQGGGRSYTLACLLENCLLLDPRFGQVQQPVADLAFNYDTDSSGAIAETVHVCSRGVKVNVLVSSSNFEVTLERYRVATQDSANVKIEKFLLPPSDLSVERMYRLMAFSEKSESVPLYMEIIQKLLRQMAVSGQGRGFNYGEFLHLLDATNFTTEQRRSSIQLTCLVPKDSQPSSGGFEHVKQS